MSSACLWVLLYSACLMCLCEVGSSIQGLNELSRHYWSSLRLRFFFTRRELEPIPESQGVRCETLWTGSRYIITDSESLKGNLKSPVQLSCTVCLQTWTLTVKPHYCDGDWVKHTWDISRVSHLKDIMSYFPVGGILINVAVKSPERIAAIDATH